MRGKGEGGVGITQRGGEPRKKKGLEAYGIEDRQREREGERDDVLPERSVWGYDSPLFFCVQNMLYMLRHEHCDAELRRSMCALVCFLPRGTSYRCGRGDEDSMIWIPVIVARTEVSYV